MLMPVRYASLVFSRGVSDGIPKTLRELQPMQIRMLALQLVRSTQPLISRRRVNKQAGQNVKEQKSFFFGTFCQFSKKRRGKKDGAPLLPPTMELQVGATQTRQELGTGPNSFESPLFPPVFVTRQICVT